MNRRTGVDGVEFGITFALAMPDCSQADSAAVGHFVATENPTLAENRTVFLAGNLLRHLKDHLNQRVLRQVHRSMEKDA